MGKKVGKYCKAYSVQALRNFADWAENAQNVRKEKKLIDGQEIENDRELTEHDYLFLQENYIVTDGIFLDENIIFANVTPEWKNFCKNALHFEAPAYQEEG